ncbi:MAG: CDP-diacylglycerol--serine O-phosphatidyltransferase [Bacteroidetes bacterium]|nr:MAG: CDP-diacylglycerol--serine O-phosphatidyltransferase [Bacteroidota bacterium]
MAWKQHIPNTLTACNLIAGLAAITLVLEGDLVMASVFIFIASLFDFLDGAAARLLDAYSELGKQLDSLADLISFGVAPGMIMFTLLSAGCEGSCNILERYHITPYFALLIPVCSAFRLAKFNIDLRQGEHFIGMPTPATAIFFASIPLVLFYQVNQFSLIPLGFFADFFSNTRVLAILTVLFSYLMISDFHIFSMKFRRMSWKGNEVRYLFLILAAVSLILFAICAIPLIIALYFILSLVFQKRIARGEND